MPEFVGMNAQTDWQAQQISHLLGRAEVLRGLTNFLNMNRPEHHSTDRRNTEKLRKEAADIPPSEVGISAAHNIINSL